MENHNSILLFTRTDCALMEKGVAVKEQQPHGFPFSRHKVLSNLFRTTERNSTMINTGLQTDDVLYRSYLNGDTTAYDQLMIFYGDSLTVYLYGYLHNWQDAEDLMIEAFARIMVKKPRISEGRFKAYLFKTGRNLASRFHARKTRILQFSFDDYGAGLSDGDLPEDMLQDEERKRVLHLCMKRIDPRLREALWLVYFEGMSYSEAASVLSVKPKKIDYLLTKGKKHLREELEKEGVTNAYE